MEELNENSVQNIKNIIRDGLETVSRTSHLIHDQINDNLDEFLNELNVGILTQSVGEIQDVLGYGVFGAVFQLNNGKALKITFDYHEAPFLYEYGLKTKRKGIVKVDKIFKIKFGYTYAYLIVRDDLDFSLDKNLTSDVIENLQKNVIDSEMVNKYREIGGDSYGIFLALKSMYDIDSNWRGTWYANLAKQKGNVVLYDGFSKHIKLSDSDIPLLNLNVSLTEAMINKRSLDQLKRIRQITKGIDIGDRVARQDYPNQTEFHNAMDVHIQTYDEYMAEPFEINQNVKQFKAKK